jgi:5-methylcytosine-specific restriction endonuclease McrA
MEKRTLVLTPWYLPYRVVSWQDAVTMTYLEKVDLVVAYGEKIRSPSISIDMPAVIRMRKKVKTGSYRIRFSRRNIFMRDGYRCMYCGDRLTRSQLTFDHVLPRSQGGRTEWENILSACTHCNTKKGNRTPAQAGMSPIRMPYKPKTLPVRTPYIELEHVPREWRDFCHLGAGHSAG